MSLSDTLWYAAATPFALLGVYMIYDLGAGLINEARQEQESDNGALVFAFLTMVVMISASFAIAALLVP